VCTGPTEAAARNASPSSLLRGGEKYRTIVQLWQNAWTEFVPFRNYGAFVAADRAALPD
jgi:putative transposase